MSPACNGVSWFGVEYDSQACAVVDQPRPAAAEALEPRRRSLLLERAEAVERVVDGRAERARRIAAAVRRHDLPEQRMVRMPAAVVADGGLLVLGQQVEVVEHLLDGAVGPLAPLERRVQVGDVSRRDACRGGSASSARRWSAQARHRRTGAAGTRRASLLLRCGRLPEDMLRADPWAFESRLFETSRRRTMAYL